MAKDDDPEKSAKTFAPILDRVSSFDSGPFRTDSRGLQGFLSGHGELSGGGLWNKLVVGPDSSSEPVRRFLRTCEGPKLLAELEKFLCVSGPCAKIQLSFVDQLSPESEGKAGHYNPPRARERFDPATMDPTLYAQFRYDVWVRQQVDAPEGARPNPYPGGAGCSIEYAFTQGASEMAAALHHELTHIWYHNQHRTFDNRDHHTGHGASGGSCSDYEPDFLARLRDFYGEMDKVELAESDVSKAAQKMRWAEWSGKLHIAREQKNAFEVAVGGHGKHWTDKEVSIDIPVRFRSLAHDDYFLRSSASPEKLNQFQFGHGVGLASLDEKGETHFVDGHVSPIKTNDRVQVTLSGDWNREASSRYDLTIGPLGGNRQAGWSIQNLGDEWCGGDIAGEERKKTGEAREGAESFASEKVWKFTIVSHAQPQHVRLAAALPPFDEVEAGYYAYLRLAGARVRPAVEALSRQRKFQEATALDRRLPGEDVTGVERTLSGTWRKVAKTYAELSGFWISDKADADPSYEARLGELQNAITGYTDAVKDLQRRLAINTERTAMGAQDASPDAAGKLRELKHGLEEGSLTSFK